MLVFKSACAGLGTVLGMAWCIWLMCWPFAMDDIPAWANWLTGGSFAVYMAALFGRMHYESTRKVSADRVN